MSKFIDAVKQGIAILDRRKPGWRKKINKEILNMRFTDTCVLAQLYGSYDEGCRQLFGGINPAVLVAHGFAMADISHNENLTVAWKSLV